MASHSSPPPPTETSGQLRSNPPSGVRRTGHRSTSCGGAHSPVQDAATQCSSPLHGCAWPRIGTPDTSTDATASALEQDPGRCPRGWRHAVHPSPAGAGGAARTRRGVEEGHGGPARRLAGCDGGRCVLGDVLAAAVQRPVAVRVCLLANP
ncbi:hypothetical protein Q4I30_003903 [Leishmania utingensis]|uniref:Uncharacterized protein n=1 Tax=Leishmania utingensis TaxID=653362 RepID=A0AAW3AI36_9TRYP